MTYPITPNAAVHHEPSSVAAKRRQVTVTQLQAMGQQMTEGITNAVLYYMTGGIVGAQAGTNSDDASAHLQAWFTQMYGQLQSNLTNFSALVTSVGGTTFNDLTAWLQNLNVQATDAYNQIVDFLETGDWNDLSTAWNDLMRGLFGSSTSPGILSQIPATAVTNVTQSLQPVWDFPNVSSIQSNSDWTWDGTQDHTGKTGSGSAKVIADGTLKTLNGTPANVQVGQVVVPQAYVMWSGLSATAGTQPIRLELVLSDGTVQTIASVTSPGASSAWTKLSGSYTVNSGITTVQMRLVVTANATAGTLNWDDCSDNVTGGFLAELQNDLTTLQNDEAAKQAAFATFLQAALATLSGAGSWNAKVTALETEWQTYTTTVSGLNNSEIFTIQQFLNSLLGVNTTTGLISPGNISSSTGGSSLQADWNSWVANLQTTWNQLFGTTSTPTSASKVTPTSIQSSTGGSSLQSDWNSWVANLQTTWNQLFGTTSTPTSTSKVNPTNIQSSTGLGSLQADWNSWVGNLQTTWNQLFGSTTAPTSSSLVTTSKVQSSTGLGNLQADWNTWVANIQTTWTSLFGSSATPTTSTQVAAASVQSVTGAASLGTDVTSAHTLVQDSLDAVNQGITGTSGTGATATQVQTTTAGLAATVAQVQSNVQILQNAGDAVVGGVQIVDDGPGITATDSGWGSNWTLNRGAHANLNKGFACTGGNVIGSYTGNSLNTDNMVAGIIFNALPNYNYFGTPADGARHRIKIRESADRSSCVFADIWHDKVQIGYRKTNTDNYIASTATSVTPAAGSNWELYGGNEAGTTPYVFKLLQNGVMASPIATWTDASHLSNLGASNRGTGQDMYSDGTLLPGNTKFHARDLIQPLLLSMVAKHENTSTTQTALTGGSIYRMPVGWFSHQTYLAPGITMASTSGKAAYIVAQEGLYEFVFSIAVTSGITGSPYIIAPVIWVNTAPDSEGGALISQNGLVGGLSISMCKSVYLHAGDEIGPAVDLRAQQWSVYGEATGTATFMQLSKVG